MRKIRVIILLVLICSFSVCVDACPLCQGGQGISKDTITAYKGVTLFLALLPIIGSAGIFYWIYKRKK